ncbi:MAG: DNA cytosine methyltransferase [Candidatus Thiodiazotropha sp.]
MRLKTIPVLSFFTGGGLLDLGLEQAGFKARWTNEYNDTFANLYEHGMTNWRRSQNQSTPAARISSREDIRDLHPTSIVRDAFPRGRPKLFGVVGGPPCPDFSNGGVHAGHNGKSGSLTRVFFDMIGSIRPQFFLFENVAGLVRFHRNKEFLGTQIDRMQRQFGYAVDFALLDALELGAPQHRERVFVVGIRRPLANRAVGRSLQPHELDWFPWPKLPEYVNALQFDWPSVSEFGGKPKKPRGIPVELTVKHAFSGWPERLPNGREYYNSYSDKFWTRDEGDVAAKSFKRLHRYRYSPTAWYGNQEVHLHPWKSRRLSVREALRIQTVPDTYVLPEDEPLSGKFKAISNGVPCLMAEKIGIELRDLICAAV